MNKDIFLLVFKNKYLFNHIFNQVKWIHKEVEKCDSLNWDQLLDRPDIMVIYNYFKMLKNYIKRIQKRRHESDYFNEYPLLVMRATLVKSVEFKRLKILKYILEVALKDDSMKIPILQSNKLLDVAARKASKKMVLYLQSIHGTITNFELDTAVLSVVSSLNLEFIIWFTQMYSSSFDTQKVPFLVETVRSGSLEILTWFMETIGTTNIASLLKNGNMLFTIWQSAFQSKNIKMLDFIKRQISIPTDFCAYMFPVLMKEHSIFLLHWLIEYKRQPIEPISFMNGLASGSVEVIVFIHQTLPENELIFHNLDTLEWFCRNFTHYCRGKPMDKAIEKENFKLIEWLHNSRNSSVDTGGSSNALDPLLWTNNITLLNWFTENRTEGLSSYNMVRILSHKKHNEVVKWLIQNQKDDFQPNMIDRILCRSDGPDWELAEWLRLNKPSYKCSNRSIDHALHTNNLHLFQWLYKNTDLFSTLHISMLINEAIQKGSLEILEWLYEKSNVPRLDRLTMGKFERFTKPIQTFIIKNLPDMIPLDILQFYETNSEMFKFIIFKYPHFINMKSLIIASKLGCIDSIKHIHSYLYSTNRADKTIFAKRIGSKYLESLYYAMLNKHTAVVEFIHTYAPLPEEMEYSKQTLASLKAKFNIIDLFS